MKSTNMCLMHFEELKQIEEFEIVDHGIEHEMFSRDPRARDAGEFDLVFTGAGESYADALETAVEIALSKGYEVSEQLGTILEGARIREQGEEGAGEEVGSSYSDNLYFVSLRVK